MRPIYRSRFPTVKGSVTHKLFPPTDNAVHCSILFLPPLASMPRPALRRRASSDDRGSRWRAPRHTRFAGRRRQMRAPSVGRRAPLGATREIRRLADAGEAAGRGSGRRRGSGRHCVPRARFGGVVTVGEAAGWGSGRHKLAGPHAGRVCRGGGGELAPGVLIAGSLSSGTEWQMCRRRETTHLWVASC